MPCKICQDEFPAPEGSVISDDMKDRQLPMLKVPDGAETYRILCPVCRTVYEIDLSDHTYTIVVPE